MTHQPVDSNRSFSISTTVASFYDFLESAAMHRWAGLWAERGVYLNPFSAGSFPQARVAGREKVLSLILSMRSRFEALDFQGRNVEPALVPENPAIVVYVTGDCHYTLQGDPEKHRRLFHHRLEIVDGSVKGWIDFTNPLTNSDAAPDAESKDRRPLFPGADRSAAASGDGVSATEKVVQVSINTPKNGTTRAS